MSAGVACIAFVVGFFVVGVVIFQKAAVGANMGAEEQSILWMHAGFLGGGIGEQVLLSPCLHWFAQALFWSLLLPLVGGDPGSCHSNQCGCQY